MESLSEVMHVSFQSTHRQLLLWGIDQCGEASDIKINNCDEAETLSQLRMKAANAELNIEVRLPTKN
jgi:hypothetical protein